MDEVNIRITLTGTGTSAGVPMIGCCCDVCTSHDPKDRRDRCGAVVQYEGADGAACTVLIDTPPELRLQMIRHEIMRIDGVVYTHNHADHVFGVDDLRRFNAVQEQAIMLYGEHEVCEWFRRTFRYVFESHKNTNQSFVPQLVLHPIDAHDAFQIAGVPWQPIRLLHGRLPILGYRIGRVAYCTDCSSIPPESYPLLEELDVLVIDALRYRHHPTHMTVDQALAVIEQVQPRRAVLTHIAHDIQHADLSARLPKGVEVGFDGMVLQSYAR